MFVDMVETRMKEAEEANEADAKRLLENCLMKVKVFDSPLMTKPTWTPYVNYLELRHLLGPRAKLDDSVLDIYFAALTKGGRAGRPILYFGFAFWDPCP
jgi:hypothetical protein